MEERRRLTLEEIDERHPRLIPALRPHPHVGWLLVRSSERGAVALGSAGAHYLAEGTVEGEDPLARSHRTRRATCSARTGSLTWPTSWSAASTIWTSRRAVPSRS